MAETIIVAVASCVGALFSGALGAALAMRRYRGERSFDARVEWHRELAETAKTLSNRSRAFRTALQRGLPQQLLPGAQDLGELAFRFQEMAQLAPLYAKPDTCSAIQEVLGDLDNLAPLFDDAPVPEQEVDPDSPHPFDVSIAGMEAVFMLLARDLRQLLGLQKLDEHKVLDHIEWQ